MDESWTVSRNMEKEEQRRGRRKMGEGEKTEGKRETLKQWLPKSLCISSSAGHPWQALLENHHLSMNNHSKT